VACRLCGRRWHLECVGSLRLCPQCTRPLQNLAREHAISENRAHRRNAALKSVLAACIGAWAISIVSFGKIILLAASSAVRPLILAPGGIGATVLAAAASAWCWFKFFQSRCMKFAYAATAAGTVLGLLMLFIGYFDLPDTRSNQPEFAMLTCGLFISAAGAAIRWNHLPHR
jgi:protein-S-isoprenylcysteine O-methyltransferase Ste14